MAYLPIYLFNINFKIMTFENDYYVYTFIWIKLYSHHIIPYNSMNIQIMFIFAGINEPPSINQPTTTAAAIIYRWELRGRPGSGREFIMKIFFLSLNTITFGIRFFFLLLKHQWGCVRYISLSIGDIFLNNMSFQFTSLLNILYWYTDRQPADFVELSSVSHILFYIYLTIFFGFIHKNFCFFVVPNGIATLSVNLAIYR